MLHCLGAEKRSYGKGELIFRAGEKAKAMGLVLSGSVNVESDDLWGNRSLLSRAGPGQIFAETYACLPDEPMMVSVEAAEPTEVLLLRVDRILNTCPTACAHHSALIRNLLAATAQKNLNLSRRMEPPRPRPSGGGWWPISPSSVAAGEAGGGHPLRPAAAGGLPQRGPQRPVRRAEQDAEGRPAGGAQEPLPLERGDGIKNAGRAAGARPAGPSRAVRGNVIPTGR